MPQLNTFPVSLKVEGQSIVIAGGGVEALNKARLAVKTSARVVVIAAEISADFSNLDVELVERAFVPADLENAALVFVADESAESLGAIAAARARNIPLNVVDRPELCDFYTPAVVDRAPISIAISTEGDAPVLARLVRAKIEAILSPQVGAVARLAGELRARVARLLPDGTARRRFYEALVTSPGVEKALDAGVPAGRREALRLLDAHAGQTDDAGAVWLIGAGPGDEDLLTLRAQRLLQEADVIVHDASVPDLLVQMGRRDAERLMVDASEGANQISGLLADLAQKGEKLAWLISGDAREVPMLAHVVETLVSEGIEFSVVPGVSGTDAVEELIRKAA